jgi:uncharacterized protein
MTAETSSQTFQTQHWPPAAKRALEVFVRGARLSYGDNLLKVIIFGSRARGDAHRESDVDIAVVLKHIHDRGADRNRLADIAYEAIVETYVDVQVLPISQDEWERPELHRNPDLIRAIKRDGMFVESF